VEVSTDALPAAPPRNGDLGDVIAVVLPNTSRDGAVTLAKRIEAPVPGIEIRVAEHPADGATLAELLGDSEWHVSVQDAAASRLKRSPAARCRASSTSEQAKAALRSTPTTSHPPLHDWQRHPHIDGAISNRHGCAATTSSVFPVVDGRHEARRPADIPNGANQRATWPMI
jgi:hypothetical protein